VTEGIAIVGMACRFPGAGGIEPYWSNLRAGADTITRFGERELVAAGVDAAVARGPDYVPCRGVIERGDRFDWAFFGYSPAEAAAIDPQQRVLLECAAGALDDAGIDPRRFAGWIGAYAGCDLTPPGWLADDPDDLAAAIGAEKDYLATRLAYKLGLRGPAVTVQTACSTSLVAVHLACQSLLCYESDAALAGGATVCLPAAAGYRWREGDILSRDGRCRPFDADASGTVSSDGAGVVVLRRLEDALRDGDRVVAVIRGSAVNNDGGEKVGYTTPSVAGQRDVIRLALAQAEVTPDQVGYVEAHGTATPVGDPIEVAALAAAFAGGEHRAEPCWLGGVKGNIGHTGVAAGVAGLVKTALMLERRELVPVANFERPNPELRLEETPFRILATGGAWRADGPRVAGVSSFGIGGTNAHVVLEEAPPRGVREASRRPRLLCLSAASPEALERSREGLAARLSEAGAPPLGDAAWTLATGRRRFPHRVAVAAAGGEEAAAALRAARGASAAGARVAFLFPGQGTLRPGAGRAAHTLLPEFRRVFDEASAIVERRFGLDLNDLLRADGDPAWTRDTCRQQLGLFVLGHGLASQLRAWGVEPAGMLGHSVGEYVAAAQAGVWTLPDAIDLVVERGRAMQATEPGRMLAVSGDPSDLVAADRRLAVAVDGPGQVVVAGPPDAIDDLTSALRERHVASRLLDVDRAFHSPLMAPAAAVLGESLTATPSARASLPLVSNRTGGWADPHEAATPAHWTEHLLGTVRLTAGLETLLASCDVFVELGPGESMTRALHRHPAWDQRRLAMPALGGAPAGEERQLLAAIGGLWERGVEVGLDDLFAGERPLRCALPAHPLEPRPLPVRTRRRGAPVPGTLSARPDLAAALDAHAASLVHRHLGGAADPARIDPHGRVPGLARFLAAIGAEPDPGGGGDLGEVAGLRRLLDRCVAAYPAVFAGERSALSVLYPDGDGAALLADLEDNRVAIDDSDVCLDALVAAVRDLPGPLRILEVGAGSGELMTRLLDGWPGGAGVRYQATDVSPLVVSRLRSLGRPGVECSVFDMTRDPAGQGLEHGAYDVVVAYNAVHVAPDAGATLARLARLLAPGGTLGLVEMTRPRLWTHLVWGLAPGWWMGDGRPAVRLDADGWGRALREAGLVRVTGDAAGGSADHATLLARAPAAATAVAEPRGEVERVVAAAWTEVLGVAPEGDADDFFHRGGDSLMILRLQGWLRERLGERLAVAAFADDPTFGNLVRLAGAREAPLPDNVTLLRAGGEGVPVFLAPPASGSALGYRHLAAAAPGDRPWFGLDARGLHDGARPADRFEALAAQHLEAVRQVRPHGPYVLGGWSIGAMVAHEMARQLVAAGEPVALLLCLDGMVEDTGGRPLGTIPEILARGLWYRARPWLRRDIPGADRAAGFAAVWAAGLRAMVRYVPGPLPCRTVLFRTGLTERARPRLLRRLAAVYGRGVDVRPAPGRHWTTLEPEHAPALAAAVAEVLGSLREVAG
jgi:acyl transferase domain-containing protein/thioesterase domain-containing protein/SAM-dependent methyltransferase